MHQQSLAIKTHGQSFTDLRTSLDAAVKQSGITNGLCHVFLKHTSASLLIQENASPSVRKDLERWAARIAPESEPWEHCEEGADDMPAHIKSSIGRVSELIPIIHGRLAFGTWQTLYLWEHRHAPHTREIIVTIF